MQQPMDSSRDEETKEGAKIIKVIPAATVVYPLHATDEASLRHVSKGELSDLEARTK
jgi:hypothetical protein